MICKNVVVYLVDNAHVCDLSTVSRILLDPDSISFSLAARHCITFVAVLNLPSRFFKSSPLCKTILRAIASAYRAMTCRKVPVLGILIHFHSIRDL